MARTAVRPLPETGQVVLEAAMNAAELLGVSQAHLARIIGVDPSTLSRRISRDRAWTKARRNTRRRCCGFVCSAVWTPSSADRMPARVPGCRARIWRLPASGRAI